MAQGEELLGSFGAAKSAAWGEEGRKELRPPREQRGAERSVQRLLFPAAFIPCLCVPSQPGTWLSLLFRAGVLAAAFCYFSLGALIIFSII